MCLPVLTMPLVLVNTSSSAPVSDAGDNSSKRTCAGGSRLCSDRQLLSVSPAKNLLGAVNTYPLKKILITFNKNKRQLWINFEFFIIKRVILNLINK